MTLVTAVTLVLLVLWMLTSLLGLALGVGNARIAAATLRAASERSVDDGRLQWATYSAAATRAHVRIKSIFVFCGALWFVALVDVGVLPLDLIRGVTFLLLIVCAAMLAALAYEWRRIDDDLMRAAARRNEEREGLVTRSAVADVRDTDQDAREVVIVERTVAQDDRSRRQTVRGTDQDARGVEQDERGVEQDRWSGEHPVS